MTDYWKQRCLLAETYIAALENKEPVPDTPDFPLRCQHEWAYATSDLIGTTATCKTCKETQILEN